MHWTRRSFLRAGIAAGVALYVPPVFASRGPDRERILSLHNLHTGERVEAAYWSDGRYLDESLAEIDRVLRDFRTGEVKAIDRKLLDVLVEVRSRLDSKGSFEVISGYRSAQTNAALSAQGRGVARRSLHVEGKAVDVRLSGTDLAKLRRAALDLGAGGVGFYPKPGFVHLDVGRVRAW